MPPIQMPRFNGQAAQDLFVRTVLNEKRDGTFVEIGSNHPITINNTFLLEKELNWRGIMVEYDPSYLEFYQGCRSTAHHVIADATTVNFAEEFAKAKMPADIDYLQVDLEVSNGSTINTLVNLDDQVMDAYRFATVTFEHDIYSGDHHDTRQRSREIFQRRGYARVVEDVSNDDLPYEDWYVHPDLVDMELVRSIQGTEYTGLAWRDIIKRF
jgi:hypothetical protein